MILFQILIFFISIVLISLSISGYGRVIDLNTKKNFFLDIFLGFIIISFIITFLHFFLKINLSISFLIFIFGILVFFFKENKSLLKLFKTRNIFFLIIIFLFIPIFISQKYHEDFGYYHLPYIVNFTNEKIIFGIGNVNDGFVHNSIWLNILSVFYIKNNFNFVTLPSFLIYFTFLIYSINQIFFHKKYSNSNYFLVVCVFYLILKFTRISEYGNDIPALIYSIFAIFFFLKYNEEDDLE